MEGEKKAFVDVAREPARRIGDALWLQFGGRELRGREDVLGWWWSRRWPRSGKGGRAFGILRKA